MVETMKGWCPVCRGWYAVKFDGTIRAHRRFNVASIAKYSAAPPWVPCEGAGRQPVQPSSWQ